MRVATYLISFIPAAIAARSVFQGDQPAPYEAVHQSEYILAEHLDRKAWNQIPEVVTEDVVYDSRPLGVYGGLSVGIEQFIENAKKAFRNSSTGHHVSNAIIKFNPNATEANVTTYIVWSQWNPKALDDPLETFRIYERCDDLFVLGDEGLWKLKYSLVTNLAPKVENPYFSDNTTKFP